MTLVAVSILGAACGGAGPTGVDEQVTTKGSYEITADLVDISGEFPPNDLYDYAYVLKYQVKEVHRGTLNEDVIYVAHYNPLKPRGRAADARVKDIGGNLRTFRQGQVHRMALERSYEDHYMGGLINPYEAENPDPIYWAVWTNLAGGRGN